MSENREERKFKLTEEGNSYTEIRVDQSNRPLMMVAVEAAVGIGFLAEQADNSENLHRDDAFPALTLKGDIFTREGKQLEPDFNDEHSFATVIITSMKTALDIVSGCMRILLSDEQHAMVGKLVGELMNQGDQTGWEAEADRVMRGYSQSSDFDLVKGTESIPQEIRDFLDKLGESDE